MKFQLNPVRRYTQSFKCSICGHSVKVHKETRPDRKQYSIEQLASMIQIDVNLKRRKAPFCDIAICQLCPSKILARALECTEIHK